MGHHVQVRVVELADPAVEGPGLLVVGVDVDDPPSLHLDPDRGLGGVAVLGEEDHRTIEVDHSLHRLHLGSAVDHAHPVAVPLLRLPHIAPLGMPRAFAPPAPQVGPQGTGDVDLLGVGGECLGDVGSPQDVVGGGPVDDGTLGYQDLQDPCACLDDRRQSGRVQPGVGGEVEDDVGRSHGGQRHLGRIGLREPGGGPDQGDVGAGGQRSRVPGFDHRRVLLRIGVYDHPFIRGDLAAPHRFQCGLEQLGKSNIH